MDDRNRALPIPRADPARRFATRRAEIDRALARVLGSGQFILGEEVAHFETEFANYLGTRHVVGVGSGTQALSFALAAVGVRPGDEVVTVAMTFVATAVAIESVGAKPVFVDVDPETRCMDPGALSAAIGFATTAILPVHLHGIPAAMEAIGALAERHGLAVVEDCAQSHGASINGRRTGTFGHAAAFSFYPTKGLSGLGDGGAVATNDAAVAARLRRMRNYGLDESGRSIEQGTNGRLDELQAAILRVLLPDLDQQNAQRRALSAEYRARLAGAAVGLPPADNGAVYHQYAVTLDQRDAVRQRLLAQHGIDTGIHYPLAVHQHPHFMAPVALPVTERLARQFLSLPIQPEVATSQVGRIADAVLESVNACR
jgi:dTDP-4-amino-4,6-dideoxygalactose transaminase